MKILYCGDVVGRAGRNVITHHLKEVKEKYAIDVAIVNGENAAHGFGISASIFNDFLNAGADMVTTGNHIWQNRDIYPVLDNSSQIIRPLNYPENLPGRGARLVEVLGKKILVMQVLGRVFMPPVGSIVEPIEDVLKYYVLGKNADAIVVDIHAEATSEKLALGFYLDGRVSAVLGTHTHVPTADARILEKGTAYITDVGMCGDFNSVLGFDKETPIERLAEKMTLQNKLQPANGDELTIWGVVIEVDDFGKAVKIEQIAEKF
ncbi:MAG: TIGR00282 family metallophosphoesterase [Alphaproteobacteria bacterium]|nr:TIGR00282 family metallophosphoesterase [Alphaproteobacteria bacterium]